MGAVVGYEVEDSARRRSDSKASEVVEPGQMSFTMTVPAAVPSLFQSSSPWLAS